MGRVDVNLDGQEARSIELLPPEKRLTDASTGVLDKQNEALPAGYLTINITEFIKGVSDESVTVVFEDSDDMEKWHTRGMATFQAIYNEKDPTDLGAGSATFYVPSPRRYWRVNTIGLKGEPVLGVTMKAVEEK